MSIRVQRFDPPSREQRSFSLIAQGAFRCWAVRVRAGATLEGLLVFAALALPAAALAAGPQAPVQPSAQPEVHEAPPPAALTEPPPEPVDDAPRRKRFGMVRYDKPIYRHGVRVLWHGAWREDAPARGEPGPAAHERPGAQAAGRDLLVLADSADASATRMAAELASALQGAGFHAKAIAGKTSPAALDKAVGGDLADFAIAPTDALGGAADGQPVATGQWRVRAPYILRLDGEPIEVIAQRSTGALEQLSGRKVSVAAADGATAASAAIVFSRLGVAPSLTNESLPDGLARLARGEIDAVFTVGSDSAGALADFGKDRRFHIVAIPYAAPLRALYAPMRLTAHDRPNLIDGADKVDTIGVPMALLAIDAAPDAPHAERIAQATERLLAQFDQGLGARPGSRWQDVNLAATIFGWPRFGAAQSWLERNAGASNPALDAFRGAAETAVSAAETPGGADSDQLYESLMKLSGPAQ